MKNKNVKGITLISLVITIVVLIIISSIAVYSGVSTLQSSKMTTFTTELKVMQLKVNELYQKYKEGDTSVLSLGQDITSNEQANNVLTEIGVSSDSEVRKKYRYFSKQDLETLGMDEIKENEFIINVEGRKVVSYKGIRFDKRMYYTLDSLPNGLYNVEHSENISNITFDVFPKVIDKTKGEINVKNIAYDGYLGKWQIRYKLVGNAVWQTTEVFETTEYTIPVNKLGKYVVQVFNGDIQSIEKEVTLESSTDTGDGEEPDDPGGTTPDDPDIPTVDDSKGNGPFEDTTTIKDNEDNEITIPGGFEVADDSGSNVEDGIVVKDENGNEFVWIPVGEYETSKGTKINNLTRRIFPYSSSKVVEEVNGDDFIDGNIVGEGHEDSVAHDTIGKFKEQANKYKGFYIGRYEQGENVSYDNVCKPGYWANTNRTRDNAMKKSEELLQGNTFVKSELMSSYAWDTALNFICQINGYDLATTRDMTYGNLHTGKENKTGEYSADKYCNIYDMIGNHSEWTTEYAQTGTNSNAVNRGGTFHDTDRMASTRKHDLQNNLGPAYRVQVYIK